MLTVIRQRILKHGYMKLHNPYEAKSAYYFGYGANLDPDYFLKRFPGSKVIGLAQLENFKFSLNVPCEYDGKGFGGIQYSVQDRVFGTLYLISESSLRLLNILEWVPFQFYTPKCLDVFCEGKSYQAIVYEPCHPKNGLKTSPGYKNMLITGARKMSVPKAYLELLENLPTQATFKLDHSFNLASPGKKRFLELNYYKLHDKLREKLCSII